MALARIAPLDRPRPADFAAFAAGIRGTVIRPDDEGYDQAREVHNANYDRRPLCIVRASSAADVARTVLFARETGLELAVAAAPTASPGSARPMAASSSTSAR
jgi:FAD/FMN-containing dehydrogenase